MPTPKPEPASFETAADPGAVSAFVRVRARIDVLAGQTLIYDTFRGQVHLLGGPMPEPLRSALTAPVGAQFFLPQEQGAWLDQLATLGLISLSPSSAP